MLQTDDSGCGVGAILRQRDDNGKNHLVAYYSKKLIISGRAIFHYRKGMFGHKTGNVHFLTNIILLYK